MLEKSNENGVIFFSRLHWIIFFWPVVALCAALAVIYYIDAFHQISYVFAILALMWVGITWMNFYFSFFTIKKNQVIICTGFLIKHIIDIPLNKIEEIYIRQSILGSILGYGGVCITGTGGTRRLIQFLHNPLTFRRYIEQLIGALPKEN